MNLLVVNIFGTRIYAQYILKSVGNKYYGAPLLRELESCFGDSMIYSQSAFQRSQTSIVVWDLNHRKRSEETFLKTSWKCVLKFLFYYLLYSKEGIETINLLWTFYWIIRIWIKNFHESQTCCFESEIGLCLVKITGIADSK